MVSLGKVMIAEMPQIQPIHIPGRKCQKHPGPDLGLRAPLSKWCIPPVRYPWISHIVHGIIWVRSMVILWKTTYILSGMHIQVCRASMIHGIFGRYIPSWTMMNRLAVVNDFEPGGPQYPTLVEPGAFGINRWDKSFCKHVQTAIFRVKITYHQVIKQGLLENHKLVDFPLQFSPEIFHRHWLSTNDQLIFNWWSTDN